MHENTIKAGRYILAQYLPFAAAGENLCVPCKNYTAACWKKTAKELKDHLVIERNFTVYMVGLGKWEVLFVASDGKRVQASIVLGDLTFPIEVGQFEVCQLRFSRDMGVHWPILMWEKKFEQKHNPADVYVLKEDGIEIPGIIANSIHGNPTGTTAIKKEFMVGGEKKQLLASSDKELREGQLDDAWQGVQDSCRLQDGTDPGAAEDSNITLKLPPKPEPPKVSDKRKPEDVAEGEFSSSDDDEQANYIPSLPLVFKSSSIKAKAKAKGGSRAGAGSRPSALPKAFSGKRSNASALGTKQYLAIVAARALEAEAAHLVDLVQNNQGIKAVTDTSIKAKIASVARTLEADKRAALVCEARDFLLDVEDGTIDGVKLVDMGIKVIADLENIDAKLKGLVSQS